MDADQRVPRDSFAYQEVARLYGLARSLRPTAADRWNGALYATNSDNLGGLHPETGDLRLSERRVLRYLTGSRSQAHADDQAEALATVLYQATHAAMHVMAPNEPNAVWTEHSRGLMVGFAEVRTFADFDAFADRAGYGALPLGDPQYAGAFTASGRSEPRSSARCSTTTGQRSIVPRLLPATAWPTRSARILTPRSTRSGVTIACLAHAPLTTTRAHPATVSRLRPRPPLAKTHWTASVSSPSKPHRQAPSRATPRSAKAAAGRTPRSTA